MRWNPWYLRETVRLRKDMVSRRLFQNFLYQLNLTSPWCRRPNKATPPYLSAFLAAAYWTVPQVYPISCQKHCKSPDLMWPDTLPISNCAKSRRLRMRRRFLYHTSWLKGNMTLRRLTTHSRDLRFEYFLDSGEGLQSNKATLSLQEL